MIPEGVSSTTWFLLVASYIPGIGKNTLWQIACDSSFPRTKQEDLELIHPALIDVAKRTPKFYSAEIRALKQLDLCRQNNVNVVGFWDQGYPNYLRAAPASPPIIWCIGNLECMTMPMAAVIGTREPTHDGQIVAYRIASGMAERGIVVVSGLALGVDSIAHSACVDLGKPTVAVLPCGVDSVSPKKNQALAGAIIDSGGLLISEFPVGSPAFSSNFVTRDFTQAAISSTVILVQTGTSGGSLHASRAAVKLDRRLVVVNPTPRDVAYKEPKAMGNIAFVIGDKYQVQKMGFDSIKRENFCILRGKEQYDELAEHVRNHWQSLKSQYQVDRRLGSK